MIEGLDLVSLLDLAQQKINKVGEKMWLAWFNICNKSNKQSYGDKKL
jgi:hypothetical protein